MHLIFRAGFKKEHVWFLVTEKNVRKIDSMYIFSKMKHTLSQIPYSSMGKLAAYTDWNQKETTTEYDVCFIMKNDAKYV